MIQHYLKVAIRNLLRFKTQHVITIFCLTAGILCSSIAFYYIDKQSNPYKNLRNYERMVNFSSHSMEGNQQATIFSNTQLRQIEESSLYGIDLLAISDGIDQQAEITFINEQGKELDYTLYPRYVNEGLLTFYECVSAYKIDLHLKTGEVMLTESFARKVFGTQNPVGQKLFFTRSSNNNEIKYYTITNVVKDLPNVYEMNYRVMGDVLFYYKDMMPEPSNLNISGWLEKGSTLDEINQSLKNITFYNNDQTSYLSADLLKNKYNNPQKEYTKWILFLLASLVLIAALTNFLKFNIQTFYNRVRELGLRKCLGSSSNQLFAILFIEVIIVLLITTLLTFVCSELLVPYFHSLMPQQVLRIYQIDLGGLWKIQSGFLFCLFVFCALIIRIAVIRTRYVSITSYMNSSIKNGRHSIRNGIMCFQIFICVLFTGASLGFTQIIDEIKSWSYFPTSIQACNNIFRMQMTSSIHLYQNINEIVSQIKNLPGVEEVTFEELSYFQYTTHEGREIGGNAIYGDSNYLSFFHIPTTGQKPVINTDEIYISESFSKILEKDSVYGTVTLKNKTYRIAGTYPGLPFEQIRHPHRQTISAFFPQNALNTICIKAKPEAKKEVREGIESICRRFVPETIALDIETMSDYFRNGDIQGMNILFNAATFLAILSFLITILGIYSAITLDTLGRRKEVAIRKINGATPATIARLFGKLYFILLSIAFLLAFPIDYFFIKSIMTDMGITQGYGLLQGIALYVFIALLIFITVGYKIYEVMKINPAEVIQRD